MNRREILRTGSLGTLGLLASQTFQSARAQTRSVGANDRIRIRIIGFSDRLNSSLLPAFKAVADQFNCEIVGVSDIWSRRQGIPQQREIRPHRRRRNDLEREPARSLAQADPRRRHQGEQETDWKRFLCNRPEAKWDPRKYLEYRLFWLYSSGIPGQWMCHQIDTIHWFTGLPHPRSVSANGGTYQWKDGRTNFDTLTAVFDYGPLDDPSSGFQVTYGSHFTNSLLPPPG